MGRWAGLPRFLLCRWQPGFLIWLATAVPTTVASCRSYNFSKYYYKSMRSKNDAQIYLQTFTTNNRPVRPLDGWRISFFFILRPKVFNNFNSVVSGVINQMASKTVIGSRTMDCTTGLTDHRIRVNTITKLCVAERTYKYIHGHLRPTIDLFCP